MNKKQVLINITVSIIILLCILCLINYKLSTDIIYDFEYDLGEVFVLNINSDGYLTEPNESLISNGLPVHEVTSSAGKPLKIIKSPNATNVNYSEVLKFIEIDKTDEYNYIEDEFVCGQFAEMFRNNAEKYGIKTGVVIIEFEEEYYGHAINVVNTTDKGLVFIDVSNDDRIVRELKIGSPIKYGNAFIHNPFIVERVSIYW